MPLQKQWALVAASKWAWMSFIWNCLSHLPPHSRWLYSDKMQNVNTEESLLLPSSSCANIKGCYEVLSVKEVSLSCIQILSVCVGLPTLKLSFRRKIKNICALSIGFKGINTYAELHMKLGPVTLGKFVLLLSQQKKNPWKGPTYKPFHFISVCWSSTDDFM